MANNGKILLIGGLVAIPLVAAAYYKYILSNYDYSIAGVSIKGLSEDNATLLIDVDISSRIGIAFTVTDIYFDIYMEGYKVGTVYQQIPLVVPNYGRGQVQLLATIDLTQLKTNFGNIIISGLTGKQYNVSLVGYSHVKVGALPFTTNVALKFGYSLGI